MILSYTYSLLLDYLNAKQTAISSEEPKEAEQSAEISSDFLSLPCDQDQAKFIRKLIPIRCPLILSQHHLG